MRVGRGIRKEPTVQEELAREHSAEVSRMIVKQEEKLQDYRGELDRWKKRHDHRGREWSMEKVTMQAQLEKVRNDGMQKDEEIKKLRSAKLRVRSCAW